MDKKMLAKQLINTYEMILYSFFGYTPLALLGQYDSSILTLSY